MIFLIKERGAEVFYVIKEDSLGYTVSGTTTNPNEATQFSSRAEARDVWESLPEYWAEQSVDYARG